MRQVIHISDDKTYVIKHLKSQPNMSGYVVSLIEKDMKNQLLTKEDIIELIKQYTNSGLNENNVLFDSIHGCMDF